MQENEILILKYTNKVKDEILSFDRSVISVDNIEIKGIYDYCAENYKYVVKLIEDNRIDELIFDKSVKKTDEEMSVISFMDQDQKFRYAIIIEGDDLEQKLFIKKII